LSNDPLHIRDIVVPVNGSPAGADAMALACFLAKRNKGRVYPVYVIEVARTMPLDAEMTAEARRGEEVLAEAERIAQELDYGENVYGELLQARDSAHAIVDEAVERGVSAIVLGVSYSREPIDAFGPDLQYILKNAPCQVIISRSAAQE
jgi:nucleotide-binding universal stress UspA family protein